MYDILFDFNNLLLQTHIHTVPRLQNLPLRFVVPRSIVYNVHVVPVIQPLVLAVLNLSQNEFFGF